MAPIEALDTEHLLAIAAALGWASGMRLYAVVFLTGLAGHLGWVPLPSGLSVLTQPVLLWASGTMLVVEFLADKLPIVDSMWDAVHTVIRIPAGAALAAAVFGIDDATWALTAALLGGTLAATAHGAKAIDARGGEHLARAVLTSCFHCSATRRCRRLLWLSWEHPVWLAVALALGLCVAIVLIATLMSYAKLFVLRLVGARTRCEVDAARGSSAAGPSQGVQPPLGGAGRRPSGCPMRRRAGSRVSERAGASVARLSGSACAGSGTIAPATAYGTSTASRAAARRARTRRGSAGLR